MTIGNTNGTAFTFSPGVYILAGGGLTLNSQAIVTGTGITFYNTSSAVWGCSQSYSYKPITISGQVTATLSAPTSGPMDGILFFGNRTACSTKGSCVDQINGGSTAVLNGALYFAGDEIEITGSNASGFLMLVADKIYINGNSNFGNNGNPFDGITISISPATAVLNAGQQQQLTATVSNTANSAVTWSVSPSGVGTIDSSGLYTAPANLTAQTSVTVTATSQADTAKSASATITLYPPMVISISPTSVTLLDSQQQAFSASVVNAQNTAVAWTIVPAGVGTISSSGIYTAPASIAAQQTVTVTATSVANPTLSASALITLLPVVVTLSPSSASLYAGQQQQFSATVTNATNTAVAWTINPAEVGSISAGGVYTAPANVTTQQTVVVIATSEADSTKFASGVVTLLPSLPTLTLAAATPPPYPVKSAHGFIAVVKSSAGQPLSGVSVQFTVTGVNANAGTAITDSSGLASYAYIGNNTGTDTVSATAAAGTSQLVSQPVTVVWQSANSSPQGNTITLQNAPNLGLTGLCGAFTDNTGTVIEPIAIGATQRGFVVPEGATQLQLGINDDIFNDNYGSGFSVSVNGVTVTVPPTAMPWRWDVSNFNTSYQFGRQDGTNPVVVLQGLESGQEIVVSYLGGTVSAGSAWPLVTADGLSGNTGSGLGSSGTYFPTVYMAALVYPIGQGIPISASVINSSGGAVANMSVQLEISGSNTQTLQSVTNSSGVAAFTYVGHNPGTDSLVARAVPSLEESFSSNQTSITWINPTALPPAGTITLSPASVQPLPQGGIGSVCGYCEKRGWQCRERNQSQPDRYRR